MAANRVDAGLVVAAAVGVHQRLQQRQHGVALAAEPIENFLFRSLVAAMTHSSVVSGADSSPCIADVMAGKSRTALRRMPGNDRQRSGRRRLATSPAPRAPRATAQSRSIARRARPPCASRPGIPRRCSNASSARSDRARSDGRGAARRCFRHFSAMRSHWTVAGSMVGGTSALSGIGNVDSRIRHDRSARRRTSGCQSITVICAANNAAKSKSQACRAYSQACSHRAARMPDKARSSAVTGAFVYDRAERGIPQAATGVAINPGAWAFAIVGLEGPASTGSIGQWIFSAAARPGRRHSDQREDFANG